MQPSCCYRCSVVCVSVCVSVGSSVFTCIGALGTPSRTGPSLECIHRVSIAVDLCEGNKIVKKNFHPSQLGTPQNEKKSGGPGHVPSVPIG